jgi:hypothetical protein
MEYSNYTYIEDKEDLEGYDEGGQDTWSNYPIDTLLIRNETRTVHDVLRRIEKGSFVMNPDFQRDFIWPEDKQSKLIESVLMRIPLPVFYLAEDENGKMIVVDGLQRLSSFKRFVNNELKLKLPDQSDLNKKTFSDLSPKLQNRVEDCNLVLYIIDAKVPERARLDIFERVNAGVPLTRQQMRNCLYIGKGTRFLRREANTDIFIQATGNSLNSKTMRDREFVNRFCAFDILGFENYRGDMDDFLAQCLTKMNKMSDYDIDRLSKRFRNSMENNFIVFEKHAFRKHNSLEEDRSVLNASLWDVFSTGLSNYSSSIIEAKAEKIRFSFYDLLSDEDFYKSISVGTNEQKKVRTRFEKVNLMLRQVIHD